MTFGETILRLVELAKRHHYDCEDPWYSCPLAEDGCSDDSLPKDICNCSATAHNAEVARIAEKLGIAPRP